MAVGRCAERTHLYTYSDALQHRATPEAAVTRPVDARVRTVRGPRTKRIDAPTLASARGFAVHASPDPLVSRRGALRQPFQASALRPKAHGAVSGAPRAACRVVASVVGVRSEGFGVRRLEHDTSPRAHLDTLTGQVRARRVASGGYEPRAERTRVRGWARVASVGQGCVGRSVTPHAQREPRRSWRPRWQAACAGARVAGA